MIVHLSENLFCVKKWILDTGRWMLDEKSRTKNDGFVKGRIQPMCHSRLPTPETAFSLCASISGNGGQVDRRE
ncbi:MAG: hypothetical protein KAT27_11010, partial [Desulfobacterales bacterium]|nr:hypothetical protein [Desulfobacterales bacterium]